MPQKVRPNGQVALATAIDVETAAEVQRLALRRGSTVSAVLRDLIRTRLSDLDREGTR